MTIAHRPAEGQGSDDRAFIVSSWSSSYKASHYAGILWTDDYADVMHAQIERVLDRPETLAVLACDARDPHFMFGHIVAEVAECETPIVHYVFVKAPYRRSGIARGLFESVGINPWNYFVYTCKTGIVRDLSSKAPRARFDPNGIRYSKANRRRAL